VSLQFSFVLFLIILSRMYADALAHKARMEDIQKRNHEECTFHPNTSVSQSFKPATSHETTEPATKSAFSHFSRFISFRRLYEEAAARKAREIDRSLRPPEGCSFRPSLGSPSLHSPRRSKSPETATPTKEGTPRRGNTPTRLYESSKQKNEKLELLKKKVEEDRLGHHLFLPPSHFLSGMHISTPAFSSSEKFPTSSPYT
jgi:hypothetical protein